MQPNPYLSQPMQPNPYMGQPMQTMIRPQQGYPAGTRVVQAGQPMPQSYAAPQLGGTVRTVAPQGVPFGQPVMRSVVPQGSPQSVTVVRRPAAQPQTAVPTQANYSLGQYQQQAYEAKPHDPQLKNLKDLRATCGLKYVPVGDGLKGFKSSAVEDKLTRDQFLQGYEGLIQKFGLEVPPQNVKNAVFDLFDRDDNGIVDMMELICGISLLCQGTEEEKIHAVFDIFDENGDGFISMDEMFKFLTSVFKVVLTPNVMGVMRSMGVEVESAEDLASVTSLECFKAADLNQDGKLSIAEFKDWFYAPKNDPSFLFSPMRKLLQ